MPVAKTADDVEIQVGMTVYGLDDNQVVAVEVKSISETGRVIEMTKPIGRYTHYRAASTYSTREAAEEGYRESGQL